MSSLPTWMIKSCPWRAKRNVVALNNLSRVRLLTFPPNAPRPEALLALPLQHENMFYGALWLAYDKPHQFSEDEIRFLTTIAGQAALASANSQLFANAEIGRQRLAAILNSTPDPVLVTDYQGRLLLANPAAWQVLGLPGETVNGKSIDTIIQQPCLVAAVAGRLGGKTIRRGGAGGWQDLPGHRLLGYRRGSACGPGMHPARRHPLQRAGYPQI